MTMMTMDKLQINSMENFIKNQDETDSWKTIMLLYKASLKAIGTKLEILNDEFQNVHQYNPIEHIKSRIKEPRSIVDKLKRRGFDSTVENMVRYVNDIAGVRVICSFSSDIYRIADMLASQSDIRVISIKDYIKSPKESGYKSYHMIVSTPVYLSEGPVETKVEIQIRTVAMDFWASLEHKINYKFSGNVPEHIKRDLRSSAEMVSDLDAKMMDLNEQVRAIG
jgi:putative GTP pyrophosphokinase